MAYFPVYPTGWPWPLDAVQDWFEALWEHITHAVQTAARWVLDHLVDPFISWWTTLWTHFAAVAREAMDIWWPYLKDLPWGIRQVLQVLTLPVGLLLIELRPFFTWIWDRVRPLLGPVADWVSAAAQWLTSAFVSFAQDPLGGISGVTDWLWQKVKGPLTGVWTRIRDFGDAAWTGLSNFAKDPVGSLNAGFSWVRQGVTTALNGAMETLGGWVKDALGGVARAMNEALQGFLDWFLTGLGDALAATGKWLNRHVVEPIWKALQWAWDWITDQAKAALDAVINFFKDGDVMTPERAWDLAPKILATLGGLGLAATGITSVMGIRVVGTGIAVGEIGHYIKDFINPSMVTGMIVGTILGTGIRTPLTYQVNKMLRPVVPSERDLVDLRTERIITSDEYLAAQACHGLSDAWSNRLVEKAWRVPGYGELREMLWRGEISEAVLTEAMEYMSVRGDFLGPYLALTTRIPGPGDLVTMAVREVFTRPELQEELPEEFVEWMQKQGYKEPWPAYFWAMHWRLPSVTQVYDMHHRGIPMPFGVEDFLRLADISPEWREPLEKLSWSLPGAIYSRWMFRWGELGVDGLEELLVKGGLDPEWAPTVARAVAKNQFLREIHMLETNIKADLRDGFISEATARADFTELGYPGTFIEYHVKDALRDRARKHHQARLELYEDWYLKDLLTYDELESHAAEIIVDPNERELFLEDAWIHRYKPLVVPEPHGTGAELQLQISRDYRQVTADLIDAYAREGYDVAEARKLLETAEASLARAETRYDAALYEQSLEWSRDAESILKRARTAVLRAELLPPPPPPLGAETAELQLRISTEYQEHVSAMVALYDAADYDVAEARERLDLADSRLVDARAAYDAEKFSEALELARDAEALYKRARTLTLSAKPRGD
jgi:hypothetical protein